MATYRSETLPASDQATQILEAAYRCLAAKGYAHTSLRDIAREASVALSQLHYYFASKDNLMLEVMRLVNRRHLAPLRSQLRRADSPEALVQQAVSYMRRKLAEEPAWFRLHFDLMGQALWSPVLTVQAQKLYRDLFALVQEQVAAVTPALRPEVRAFAREALARFVVAALDGLALQYLIHGTGGAAPGPHDVLTWSLNQFARNE